MWVDGPEPVEIEGEIRTPKSRTFIPARRQDNRFLGADYDAQLDQMPEPMRTALKTGDFLAARQDHEWQVIPSEWVDLAFQRYDAGVDRDEPMSVLGVDVAQGGKDRTVLQPLHGRRFEQNIVVRGTDTRDGSDVGSLIIRERRDNALIVVDCTGGWGGDTVGFLTREKQHPSGKKCVFSAQSGECAKDSRIPFYNLRAQLYWRLREALHPKKRAGSGDQALGERQGAADGPSLEDEGRQDPDREQGRDQGTARLVPGRGGRDCRGIGMEGKKAELRKVVQATSRRRMAALADPLGDF
ncbi:hypothetical protein QW131_15410 [Roseibium salinum]|nr:hypothetical protein [Roseibium salinum]